MNAPLEPAHSPFGGSVAARVLRCPASVGLVEKVPAHLRKVLSLCRSRHGAPRGDGPSDRRTSAPSTSLVGKTINDYTITRDDVENALRPAYRLCGRAPRHARGRVSTSSSASTFRPSPAPSALPTCIVRIGNTIHVIDFKFGTGVRVLALYPDGDEDVINAQLLFYAAAARHSLPEFFAGVDNIVLTILQPVSIEPDAEMVSSVTVTHAELDEFIAVYRAACEEALSAAPRLERGALVPLLRGATDLPGAHRSAARSRPVRGADAAAPPSKDAYLQLLAAGLNLVDAVKDIRTALHDQAKRALENGDIVPGYALSAGRAERHWRDENAAIAALIRLGLTRDDIIAETMRSPKQVELRAKARGLKVPNRIHRFAPLRRLAGAERKRTRPGARTGRDRAVFFRGTRSLPGGRQP